MTLVRKGSRLIVVDGTAYRWRVRRKPTYSQGLCWSPSTFAVELSDGSGATPVVETGHPHPANWMNRPKAGVRPADVAEAVHRALGDGWDPAKQSSPFHLDLSVGDPNARGHVRGNPLPPNIPAVDDRPMSDDADPSLLLPYPKIAAGGRIGAPEVREWIALEKVHGAHFAVVCDVTGAHPAKRRELLPQDDAMDGFFGVSRIWPTLAVAAARLAAALRAACAVGPQEKVTIYGELAGGGYPHPDVTAVPGVDPVQTGVWYAPDLRWLPFDAAFETPEGRCWVSDQTLRDAAEIAGLVCVPVLARGPSARLQELPSAFPSKVSSLFGLPALDDNLAEGYVLKPAGEWREGREGKQQDAKTSTRPLAKVKQKNFAEDERFEGSRPYLAPPEGAAGVPAWLLVQASALLTPSRAAAAVSKTGPAKPADDIAREITRDVLEELATDLGGLDEELLHALELVLHPAALSLARFDAADRRPGSPRAATPQGVAKR
ncbi:MAG TPA: RNA ligase family protein [Actinocrinis sp.]|nr:RNA ligase family protein [Actinocrinis sp.]